ncbi:baseplate J/gp47 family protein [Streptomyces sp. NPDC014894]|uniref:baseplate J/gp47 family protein n=1 Tax=Streptomyces sp. NPDC014894 TaxID=3364931 RepID=UPI0036F7D392
MTLPAPKLDDLTWDAMMTAVRRRVPAESDGIWTLHAPADPGITLLELFAHLLEQRLYWLDQTPDALVVAVLRLLGLDPPRPARAAATVLQQTAGPADGSGGPLRAVPVVPAGTALSRDPLERVVFTLDDDVAVCPLDPGGEITVETDRDRTADLRARRGVPLLASDGSAARARFTLPLTGALPAPGPLSLLVEIDAPAASVPSWLPGATEGVPPPARLTWSWFRPGTDVTGAFEEVEDGTAGLRRSGVVRLRPPSGWTTRDRGLLLSTPAATFTVPPRLLQLAVNVSAARHRREHTADGADLAAQLGAWLKLPGRRLVLPDAAGRLLEAALRLAGEEWRPEPDFTFGSPTERVFLLDRAEGALVFGDGLTGRIPRPDTAPGDPALPAPGDPLPPVPAPGHTVLPAPDRTGPDDAPAPAPAASRAGEAPRPDAVPARPSPSVPARPSSSVPGGPSPEVPAGGGVPASPDPGSASDCPDPDAPADSPESGAVGSGLTAPGTTGPSAPGRAGPGGRSGTRPAGPAAPDVRVVYAVGGGRAGNGGITGNWLPVGDPPPGADGLVAANLVRASGGEEPETVAEARRRAAGALGEVTRAVTADDYVTLARTTPGVAVARAHASVGEHPGHPCATVPGAVTVRVVPLAPRDDPAREDFVAAPRPDPGLLGAVAARLGEARLLTSEVFVRAPDYREVALRIDLAGEPADRPRAFAAAASALRRFLDPLVGGEDGDGWPFGEPLRPSALLRIAQRALGRLADVSGVAVGLDGDEPGDTSAEVRLRPGELPVPRTIRTRVVPAAEPGEGLS